MKSIHIALVILFLVVMLALAITTAFPPESGADDVEASLFLDLTIQPKDTMSNLHFAVGAGYEITHEKVRQMSIEEIRDLLAIMNFVARYPVFADSPIIEAILKKLVNVNEEEK